MNYDKGSFRDPAGRIFHKSNRVFRHIYEQGKNRIDFIQNNKILDISIKENFLIESELINDETKKDLNLNCNSIYFEHKKIPYISYPYEWSFFQLKEAALHHLNFHIFLLEHKATLIDASAYNIQFIGTKPVFIDLLSIREYVEGELWFGHKQFCENFLNPLILSSYKGINFNNWFKGNLEGILTEDLNNILSWKDKLSYNVFFHVYLLNKFENKYKVQNKKIDLKLKKNFPKKNFISLLKQMRNFINKLEPKKKTTVWENYSEKNTYTDLSKKQKSDIVKKFIEKSNILSLADLGCNDGYFSKVALENGCKNVVGFDFDINSINRAFKKNKNQESFLPLYFDATNPSSNIGWNESERKCFSERFKFDGVIALAFLHHLVIAKNILLEEAINWILNIAPSGLLEFVPKNDDTVKKMLQFKGDIFPDYNQKNFELYLTQKAKIISKTKLDDSDRIIYQFSVK